MTELRFIGGPLDGASRPLKAAPAKTFVWVDGSLRCYRDPGKGRLLYRFEYAQKVKDKHLVYLIYAGHSHAPCCGAFVKIDRDKPQCPFCEAQLTPQ